MKVKELIKKLSELPPNAEVVVHSHNFETNHALVSLQYVSVYTTGIKRDETFRDAFDGGTYSKETYSLSGGKLKIVNLWA